VIFFLWRHYTIQHERENDTALEDRQKEKKQIQLKIREAKKGGADSQEMGQLQYALRALA